MRVVRVARRGETTAVSFDLHGQLTVVRGLRGANRSWLIDTVGRLDASRAAQAVGEIEAAGVLLPIEPESFELLGIDEAAEGVIDGRRLLGKPADDGTATGSGDELEPAASDDHPVVPDEGIDPVDSWFREPGDADGDDGRSDGIESLLELFDSDPADAEQPKARNALEKRTEALRDRRHELERLADAIAIDDLREVAEALEAWDAAPTGVPIEEAAELADAWHDMQKDLKGLELGASAEEKAALEAVNRAREAVADAEAALLVPQLTEEQMARIEAAHAAYIEASDKVERRFGGGRARRQLADAEAEEARLLSRFGFDSWVDFMLTASKRTEDPEMAREHAALEEARAELEVCVSELDAIPGAVGRRHRRARLREVQDELSDKVARVLGHEPVGDDVESELRTVKAPYDPVKEAAGLAGALERAGVDVSGLRGEPVRLAAKAQHILAVQAQAEKRRAELLVAVEALDEALSVLNDAAAAGATEPPPMPPLPDMAEPPVGFVDRFDDDGHEGLAVLFERDDDSEPGSERGGGADQDESGALALPPGADVPVDEAGGDPAASAGADTPADIDEPETGPEPDPELEPGASDDAPEVWPDAAIDFGGLTAGEHVDRRALLDDVHWEAMMAIADLRIDGPAGQLPVVLDDPFSMLAADECVELLSRLVRLTDHVQMVVVTDRPEVAEWAEAIGPDHARVLEVAG